MAWEDVLHFYVIRTGTELTSIIQCIDDADWMRISVDADTGGLSLGGVVRIEGAKEQILQQLDSCAPNWPEFLRFLD